MYDDAGLAALTEGFSVDDRRIYRRLGATVWAPVPVAETPVWSDDAPGVALLTLRKA